MSVTNGISFVNLPQRDPSSRSEDRWNDLFETLSSPRRRTIMATLQREKSATVSELATKIAKTERRDGSNAVPPEYHRAVVASLTHTHLPKLVDDGFVRWNHGSGVVSPTDTCKRLDLFFVSLESTVGAPEDDGPVV